jgi:ribosome recycling factor
MIDEIITEVTDKMDKTVANLAHEFSSIRTGRAAPAMLDRIIVDYYGTPTPVTQLAGIKSPEAHLLVVEPWDKKILGDVVKAIQKSDLGITPSNDGNVIRLPFPPLTEERRKELAKQCGHVAEEAKIALRNERRAANTKLQKLITQQDVPKDEVHRAEERVQKLTDDHVTMIEEAYERKRAEIMEV